MSQSNDNTVFRCRAHRMCGPRRVAILRMYNLRVAGLAVRRRQRFRQLTAGILRIR